MNIVVITQNEDDHIGDMIDVLSELDGVKVVYVLDRCTDNSKGILEYAKESYIETRSDIIGRQTSHSRNLGLSVCDPDKDILFLDGDRYPIEGILDFSDWPFDIALLKLEEDTRDIINDYQTIYGTVHNGFYSCGVFIKREALNKIMAFQDGDVFSEDVQGIWGIEDTYLGDVCYHLGLTCDLHPTIRLQGRFDKRQVKLDALEQRFKLRDKLNVKW